MIAHLLLLQAWSVKNRILARVRRLRQVRYLVATAAGLAYIALVWRPWRAGRLFHEARIGGAALPDTFLPLVEYGIGGFLLLIVLLRWLWPGRSPVLTFSEAEVAFLFPAPLTRRQLVRYSLIRSQPGILFTALMITLFGLGRVASSSVFAFVAGWVIFTTLQLNFLASTITRSNLLAHGRAGWRRSWPVLAVGVAILAAVAAWALFWFRPPSPEEHGHLDRWALGMLSEGPLRWLTLPGRILAKPALAPDLVSFVLALVPALGVLVLHQTWVVRSDFAFEEASAERAARRAEERARRAASGRRGRDTIRAGPRRAPFELAVHGRPEIAFLWKNLIATSRYLSMRYLIFFAGPVFLMIVVGLNAKQGTGELLHVAGILLASMAGVLMFIGPTLVRSDLRMDLIKIDLLKSYPLRGRSLVAAEVLAPVVIVTILQALFLAAAVPLLAGLSGLGLGTFAAGAIGVVLLAAPLNLVTALVQNAALLAFPTWHRVGLRRPRGIEAFGQALIAGVVRFFVMGLVFLPTALILAVGGFLLYGRFGPVALPFVGLAGAVPAVVEGFLGLEAVGLLFDRFDPSKELDTPT